MQMEHSPSSSSRSPLRLVGIVYREQAANVKQETL